MSRRARGAEPAKPCSVRYTESERAEIDAVARAQGFEPSAWIRFVTIREARKEKRALQKGGK